MPWCPKCKIEYMENYDRCSDCETELVDELPADNGPEMEYDTKAFLMTAGSSLQADILESKLKFYGIPVMRIYRESGGYLKVYMGATPFGVDLYVPSKLLTVAKELIENSSEAFEADNESNLTDIKSKDSSGNGSIDSTVSTDGTDDTGNTGGTDADGSEFKRAGARTLIIVLFFIPAIIWVVFKLIQSIIKHVNQFF